MPLDISSIRGQFPILDQRIDGNPLVYLDSAATAQKPNFVLDAMAHFYEHDNANAHRGMHVLAERATVALENARVTVQKFLNAKRPEEIIFTKNTTEAINLVARSFGSTFTDNDAVVLMKLEHHSNIVPWLQLGQEQGAEIYWVDIENDGMLKLDELKKYLELGTIKLVAVTGQSNVLGVRPPLKEIIAMTHDAGAKVLVDAAQLVAHSPIDVQDLDCDFLAFSGHKLYGPTGIGVLYGKRELLQSMPPFLGGGMMIGEVRDDSFTCADIPQKFEAGTQPIAEAVGLAAAIEWLTQFSWTDIELHEKELLEHCIELLSGVPGLHLLGPWQNKPETRNEKRETFVSGCISFIIDGVHPHDLTEVLGRQGICLRAGHHCAQPLHRRLGVEASSRVSFGLFNVIDEITSLAASLEKGVARLQE